MKQTTKNGNRLGILATIIVCLAVLLCLAALPAFAASADEVKAMIDALPSVAELEQMSDGELDEVYIAAQDASDSIDALSEEEWTAIVDRTEKLTAIMAWFNDRVAETSTISASYKGFVISFDEKIYYRNFL